LLWRITAIARGLTQQRSKSFLDKRLFRQLGFARAPEIVPNPAALGAAAERKPQHGETEYDGYPLLHDGTINDCFRAGNSRSGAAKPGDAFK
jgi:hypothetical protein